MAVALRHITKRYPGVLANDDVSLDIRAGEVHVLLGENGAGKSTLIGLLAGMRQPDAGEICVDGRVVRLTSPRAALSHGIGTVFQHALLVPSLTVIENLLLGDPWWRRFDRSAARARLAALLALLPSPKDLDARVDRLSRGQQQQVEMLRALWRGGRVLVLDEPTAMLGPAEADALLACLRRLRDRGVAVVLVTHRLREACVLADRVTVLNRGRVAGRIEPEACRSLSRAAFADLALGLMFGRGHVPDTPARRCGGAARPPRLIVRGATTGAEPGACSLHGVSFEVAPGEIFGIAGIVGNGQRHLAECLGGQRPLTRGSIMSDGKDVTAEGVRRRRRAGIVYLSDDRFGEATAPRLSVAINLVLDRIGDPPLWRYGLTLWDRIAAHATERIARDDIRVRSGYAPVATLSGGNAQRLILARDLPAARSVAVFHQPTNGLDPRSAAVARSRIATCAERGASVVLISSDLDEVLPLADRIGVLADGRLAGIVPGGVGADRAVGALIAGRAP